MADKNHFHTITLNITSHPYHTFFESLNVLEGVVQLRVGHGPGLEPAVEHFVHALQGASACG